MKKPLAIALLSVGNVLLTLFIGYLALGLVFAFQGLGVLICLVILAAHTVGIYFLKRVYVEHGWLTHKKYWLISAVPPLGISALGFILTLILDSIGFFKGFLSGAVNCLTFLFSGIYALVFLIVTSIVLCPQEE
ncbi:MAG: hypothetical protein ACI4WS_07170 [Oscillospiraceae bacterium]